MWSHVDQRQSMHWELAPNTVIHISKNLHESLLQKTPTSKILILNPEIAFSEVNITLKSHMVILQSASKMIYFSFCTYCPEKCYSGKKAVIFSLMLNLCFSLKSYEPHNLIWKAKASSQSHKMMFIMFCISRKTGNAEKTRTSTKPDSWPNSACIDARWEALYSAGSPKASPVCRVYNAITASATYKT